MNVKELIEQLQQYPLDAPVIRTMCSEYDEVDVDQIKLIEIPAKETQPEWRCDICGSTNSIAVCPCPQCHRYGNNRHYSDLVMLHHGRYIKYHPSYAKPEDVQFVTVVHFAGN